MEEFLKKILDLEAVLKILGHIMPTQDKIIGNI